MHPLDKGKPAWPMEHLCTAAALADADLGAALVRCGDLVHMRLGDQYSTSTSGHVLYLKVRLGCALGSFQSRPEP